MKTGNNMLFSIITVTYNAASVLRPTLESVKEQTFHDYEYLVIDGASSDNTLALVEAAGIENSVVYSEPDKGLYDAMNKAIDRAKGQYLIFLNAGDAFANAHTLELIAETAHDGADVIYGQTQLVDNERKVVGMRHLTAPKSLDWKSFKDGMLVCHQAFIARCELCPHYDLNYRFSADYDWCIKVLKQCRCTAYVGDTPIISFLTDGLTTKNHKKSLGERYRIMCHYYGTLPTMLRHVRFACRHLMRKFR
ncbi:MAG: glycosyltransferase [Muribaculaceae bacterium]|nr:glycosyltransferase [Muribaculaceae bacterium]